MDLFSKLLHSVSIVDEKSSILYIRSVLRAYQQQSPAHLELALEVHEFGGTSLDKERAVKRHSSIVTNVLIEGNSPKGRISVPLTCLIVLIERGVKAGSIQCKVITYSQRAQLLEQFLSFTFPVIDTALQQDTLWHWWQNNGKMFNWARLPTELKEHVIEYCVHESHASGVYSEKLTRFNQRYKSHRRIRKPGPQEIVQQLGDWFQLLYVSHQIRAITLRLCIFGGRGLAYANGLCLVSSSPRSFAACLNRLGDYYQMVEENSVPTTAEEEALSKCYGRFPRIYPELHRYATLRHGVQKISLGMDFHSFMHFFKVQAGGFQQLQKPRDPTYEVFERMPHLNEIVIQLPLRPHGGWKNNPSAGRPPLFHYDKPCPRILHRLIYERAAEVLAPYEKVKLRNFIDGYERKRFLKAREQAIEAFNFTKVDLEKLYADDGGGVELGVTEREVGLPAKAKHEDDMGLGYAGDVQGGFFPPLCYCDDHCALSPALW